jgi:hypothetical protein
VPDLILLWYYRYAKKKCLIQQADTGMGKLDILYFCPSWNRYFNQNQLHLPFVLMSRLLLALMLTGTSVSKHKLNPQTIIVTLRSVLTILGFGFWYNVAYILPIKKK